MVLDLTKVNLWAYADVYFAASVVATNPATVSTPFSGSWGHVGLLDGDEGLTHSRDVDSQDYFAWGGILVKTSRRNFKHTAKFMALEDNPTTRSLIWPGSSPGSIVTPRPIPGKIAFETRDDSGKIRRLISAGSALVELDGDIKDAEGDLTKFGFTATIYPTAGGVLFIEQSAPSITSIALTPLTLALSAATPIGRVLATATYSDASTGDVSALVNWSTTDASKATVLGGFVTRVAAGSASISANYAGVNSTAPAVVTVS
jgi:hypothetical protein